MCCTKLYCCCLFVFSLLMPASIAAHAHDAVEEMATAAERFLDTLDEPQRTKAVYEMLDEERENWHFLPDKYIRPDGVRYGLPLEQMDAVQRALAHSLVNTGLSPKGYLTAMTITSLEQVLHDLEKENPIRNPERYYLTIFGKPGDQNTWGWRFEGHHLSINVTIVEGKLVSVTPSFFGANPAVIQQGSRKGLWTLQDEEQIARNLVTSLSDEQKKSAIISGTPPDDIITREQRKVDKGLFTSAKGIACNDLNEVQQKVLLKLIKVYAEKFRPAIVSQINERTKLFDLTEVYFVWIGSLQPGKGHYYRVQTPKFLFEYDNTRAKANHVHTVWRDFEGDFGADLLRRHYDNHHAKQRQP